MRVLVIGGAGYVGTALVHKLLADPNINVFVVDSCLKDYLVNNTVKSLPLNPSLDFPHLISHFEEHYSRKLQFRRASATNLHSLLEWTDPHVLIFLARFPSPVLSVTDRRWWKYAFVLESRLTAALADISTACKVVYVSSFFEDAEALPVLEDSLLVDTGIPSQVSLPTSPNYVTDVFTEQRRLVFNMIRSVYNLPVVEVCSGSVYGLQTAEINTETTPTLLFPTVYVDPFFGTVLNRFCAQSAVGRFKIPVFGSGRIILTSLHLLVETIYHVAVKDPNPPQRVNCYTAIVDSSVDLAYLVRFTLASQFDYEVGITFRKVLGWNLTRPSCIERTYVEKLGILQRVYGDVTSDVEMLKQDIAKTIRDFMKFKRSRAFNIRIPPNRLRFNKK